MILTTTLILMPSCIAIDGRPPEYSVHNPNAIPDGAGGVIVAYQTNSRNRETTYLQRLEVNGEALWNEQGVELGSGSAGFAANDGEFAALVTDKQGNITVVYSLEYDMWATKLDLEGNPVWEGEPAREISPASEPARAYFEFNAIGNPAGETVTAWVSDNDHISIQKSDSDLDYTVSVPTPDVHHFDIAGDDRGNVFLIWKDNYRRSEGNIFVQKVDKNGQASWSNGGLQLNGLSNPASIHADVDGMIAGDGEGGAIAVWVQGALSKDGKLIIGSDLHAQHMDSEGEKLWEENGVPVAADALDPVIIGNNSGNATIFWTGLHNIYVQRLDADGNVSWPEGGINAGQGRDLKNIVYYSVADDGAGGAIIVWNFEENDNKYVYAQRIDSRGNKLWGNNGIEVSTLSPYWAGYAAPARIVPDGTGGFYVTWASGEHIKDRTSSYIQRISAGGKVLWGEDGIKLNP